MNLREKPFFLSDEDILWVEESLKNMTSDEKVGQLFAPIGKEGLEEDLKKFIDKYHPGAMMYRPNTKEKITLYHQTLQSASKIPLLLAANLESGGNGIVTEGTTFGKHMQVAATGEEEQAYRLGKVAGREAREVGVNWSFGPVVDVDINFRNPITNVRTFGSDVNTIVKMAKAYIQGVKEEGIAAAIKHFPGDGVDERDQHLLTSVNDLSIDEWEATFGKIYRTLIDDGVLSVMAGHIKLPAYQKEINPQLAEKDFMPATLSQELLIGLLRERLGFEGVIVTDATPMMGFNMAMSRRDAVPTAIASGCDMFLFNKNIDEDYQFMLEGIERGLLTWERVDEAVTRILAMKAALGLHIERKPIKEPIAYEVHKQWAKECADKSVTLVKDTQDLLPISPEKYKRIRMYVLGDKDNGGFKEGSKASEKMKELLEKEGFEVQIYNKEKLDFKEIFYTGAEGLKDKFDLAFYLANVETASNQTTVRLDWVTFMAADGPWFLQDIPTMFISTANPYHLFDVPNMKTFINSYSAHEEVLEAVVEKIMGRSEFVGISPVDPFCGRKETTY
jgi:beta-N-acetylhexosaminidase